MKKPVRMLSLRREVLHLLSQPEALRQARGGKTMQAPPATGSCQYTACNCY
jgi:hypothetical protein